MMCQYSRRDLVSSEKHEKPSGVEGRGGDTSGVTIAAEVPEGYGLLLVPPAVVSRAAKVAKTLKSRTLARLYLYETLPEGLASTTIVSAHGGMIASARAHLWESNRRASGADGVRPLCLHGVSRSRSGP
jgi:hypothetical protein